jgi:hypothetical protein
MLYLQSFLNIVARTAVRPGKWSGYSSSAVDRLDHRMASVGYQLKDVRRRETPMSRAAHIVPLAAAVVLL